MARCAPPSICDTALTQCLVCVLGFLFLNSMCTACIPNCVGCDANSTCVACTVSYFLTDALGCQACPNDCALCDSNATCTTCEHGYFLNGNSECKDACADGPCGIGNCTTTSDLPFYECDCPTGYDRSNCGICKRSCPEECALCDINGTCTTCNPGYFLDQQNFDCKDACADGPCGIGNCTTTAELPFYECDCPPGYNRSNCKISCPKDCALCELNGTCTACKANYFLNEDSVCTAPCRLLTIDKATTNVGIMGKLLYYRHSIIYTCEDHYIFDPPTPVPNVLNLTCENGNWTGYDDHKCKKLECKAPPDIDGAENTIEDRGYEDGEVVNYTCLEKSAMSPRINNPNFVQLKCSDCDFKPKWSGYLDQNCEAIKCPKPPVELYATYTSMDEYPLDTKVTYKCDDGYGDPTDKTTFEKTTFEIECVQNTATSGHWVNRTGCHDINECNKIPPVCKKGTKCKNRKGTYICKSNCDVLDTHRTAQFVISYDGFGYPSDDPSLQDHFDEEVEFRFQVALDDSRILQKLKVILCGVKKGSTLLEVALQSPTTLSDEDRSIIGVQLLDVLPNTLSVGGVTIGGRQVNHAVDDFKPVPIVDVCTLYKNKGICKNGGICQIIHSRPVCGCPEDTSGTECETRFHQEEAQRTEVAKAVGISLGAGIGVVGIVFLIIIWAYKWKKRNVKKYKKDARKFYNTADLPLPLRFKYQCRPPGMNVPVYETFNPPPIKMG